MLSYFYDKLITSCGVKFWVERNSLLTGPGGKVDEQVNDDIAH